MSDPEKDDFRDWLLEVAVRETGLTREQITKLWAEDRREKKARREQRDRDLLEPVAPTPRHWSETDTDEEE